MNSCPLISIVSPVYKAEKIIKELVKQLVVELTKITEKFEIILVDDYSPDSSWEEIVKCCKIYPFVKGIRLSRNFGQHYAITAGLAYIKGKWIIVMDCDLQDRPDEIVNLYRRAQEGFHIVYARRKVRKDGFLKRMSSKLFYMVSDYLSGLTSDGTIANFGIYHHKVIDQFNRMKEQSRSFGTLINYLGFRKCAINVAHSPRFEGKTSYSIRKLIHLAVTVSLASSNKSLRLATKMGFSVSFLSIVLAFYNIVARLTGVISLPGYTSTIFSIWFVGGLIMFMMGILGAYIGKIFDEVKSRPLFVVQEEVNIDHQ